MAGESPDKSDRKQPSGETARSEQDPRLAVFRREPDETQAGKPADGSAQGPEAAQGAAGGAAATSGGGDRPRGATAARTATADGGDGNDGDGDGGAGGPVDAARMAGDGDEDAVAKPGAKTAVTAEKKAEKKVEAKAEATPENGPEAGPKGEPAAVTAGAERGAKAGAKAAVAGGADGDAGADGAADVDGAADAEAAVVAGGGKSGAGSKAGPEAKSGAEAEPGAGAKSAGAAEDGAKGGVPGDEPAPDAVDKATAVFATLGAQKSGDKGRSAGQSLSQGKGEDEGAGAGRAEGAADEASVDTATRTFTIAKTKANGTAKRGGATEEQAEQPVDQPTAIFKIAPPVGDKPEGGKPEGGKSDGPKPGADDAEPAGGAKPVDGGKTSKSGSGEAKSGEGKDSKAKAKDGKDGKDEAQGKESRQSKGDGAKADGAKADEVKGGGAKDAAGSRAAERDAERTSQFVALKSTDTGAAERSLGKTADRAPGWGGAAAPGKASDKASEKDTGEESAPAAKDKAAASGAKPSAAVTGATAAAPGTTAPGTGATGASAAAQPKAGSGALPDSEQTRQQPLPPLDLLAKLTNTPPPPETKLRTTVRRFKIWTPLVVLLAIIFVVVQAVRPVPAPKLAVGAEAAFTFKGGELNLPWPDQGQATAEVVGVGSLGTSGQEKPVPTASVAKVMTAYVILRDHPLKKKQQGESITIDAKAEADSKKGDESRVPVKEGQKFSEYQMLQMLMIPSGNNAARQLARWDAQSEEAFVKKMNDAAKKMGMTKTTYTDPSGLDEKTVSTPADQLKLAELVMKNDVFREIVAMENVKIDGLPETLYANNSLLTTMPGVVRGIKTGSSSAAGGAFMWAAYRTVGGETQTLLGVTMDQRTTSKDPNAHLALGLKNSEKVIKAVRDALVSDTVVKKGQVVGYVDDGLGGRTPVVATKDLKAVGWPGMKATFSMSDGGKAVPHTAKAGTEIGVLTVGNGESVQKVPVALQKDLVEPSFGAKLTRIS